MLVEVMLKDRAVYEEIKGNAESFLNTLLFTGYLTIDKKYQKEDNKWYANVRIPNIEIETTIKEMQKIGIKEIWLYSIEFCQKKMIIKKEKLKM